MDNKKHYIAAVTAFVTWGFFSIPLRALKEYSAGEILYFRIMFSLLVLMVILIYKRKDIQSNITLFKSLPKTDKRKTVLLTLVGGMLLTVNWMVFIYIVNNVNIKTASFSYLICPVITAALGFLLLKEKMTPLQWLAVLLCAISCVLVGMSSALELGYSVLTALTYALYLISQRRNAGFDRMFVLAIQVLFSFIILSTFAGVLVTTIPTSFYFYGMITIIAVVFTVFPLFLNLFALNRINSATIGILMYLNPLINFSLAFLLFGERVTGWQIVGYSIIAVALIVFNYENFGKIRTRITAQS